MSCKIDLDMSESVQPRTTRFIPYLRRRKYEERLKELDLFCKKGGKKERKIFRVLIDLNMRDFL